ncbi:cobalamin-independent methionine synthase II family protein [Capillimicrobium parvum]|uniref:5-methyltetrahydropteroyltriglutamate--homocysteine methyltransferase n=1 Tax=Capillimicrobium parvum TaxID=2884022 RepID=A0A9E7C6U0_9ACTN|nr:cobalamin-independent methionine synthase II family protein [Capillimicrobium parvum]UGS38968.1 5-methyltetrahydropteroyltriglutamate--homocysteine methyltransferase [Capillimicrobium parvum]
MDRILTTHAGSLPRPDDLVELVWARMDGQDVDEDALEARIAAAVDEVVRKQREAGIDVVSDGEMSKPGFSTYVEERFTGFAGRSEFQADDVAPFPNLAMRLFATDSMAHVVFSNCVGPVEVKDPDAVTRDIEHFRRALGDAPPATAFMGAISPGQIAFNYPNQHYPSHEAYLEALAGALRHEYRAITDAGFNLQIDSPDLAMAAHCRSVGSSIESWDTHLPLAIDALNRALEGIPPEQVRLHVCWGNYAGPHHCDIGLDRILPDVLKANVGTIYPEGANPRHEHEWAVFKDVALPDGMRVILGTIDTKSNYVEHPRVVAGRLTRLANVIGAERVVAGTDCGFDTFIRFSQVDPGVAWLKLRAMSDGAELASQQLF